MLCCVKCKNVFKWFSNEFLFSWVNELFKKSEYRDIDALGLCKNSDLATCQARKIDQAFLKSQKRYRERLINRKWLTVGRATQLFIDLTKCSAGAHFMQFFITCVYEIGRLLIAVFLKEYFDWLQYNHKDKQLGWVLSTLIGSLTLFTALVYHVHSYLGYRLGTRLRQQCMALIQAKVLRLNTQTVGHITTGQIINLVTNDARRFNEYMKYWPWLIVGPFQVATVTGMMTRAIGIYGSLAAMGTLILTVLAQTIFNRTLNRLRVQAAIATDKRIRLTNEAVMGALHMKLLTTEQEQCDKILQARAQESKSLVKKAVVRACNACMWFVLSPLSLLAAVAVAFARERNIAMSDVYYVLYLLSLPKLSIAVFYLYGVLEASELAVSLKRISSFLDMPEPAQLNPSKHTDQHQTNQHETGQKGNKADQHQTDQHNTDLKGNKAIVAAKRTSDEEDSCHVSVFSRRTSEGQGSVYSGGSDESGKQRHVWSDGSVIMTGGQYDWEWSPADANTDQMQTAQPSSARHPTTTSTTSTHPNHTLVDIRSSSAPSPGHFHHFILDNIKFHVRPGELVGITGRVGSGKSSLLYALIGELQPVRQPRHSGQGQVGTKEGQPYAYCVGKVAFCDQVPWLQQMTVQENVVFSDEEVDQERYNACINACQLQRDIASFVNKHQTLVGEAGVNLSGGQKARMCLARAAYSTAPIKLLDDPLSAVDPRVAELLWSQCIGKGGFMHGCTRVIVTHQIQFLPLCDKVLVLKGPNDYEFGPWDQLLSSRSEDYCTPHRDVSYSRELSSNHEIVMDMDGPRRRTSEDEVDCDASYTSLRRRSVSGIVRTVSQCSERASGRNLVNDSFNEYWVENKRHEPRKWSYGSGMEVSSKGNGSVYLSGKDFDAEQAMKEEVRTVGSISWHVYWAFVRYCGSSWFLLAVAGIFATTALALYIEVHIGVIPTTNQEGYREKRRTWFVNFGVCIAVHVVSCFSFAMLFKYSLVRGVNNVHASMAQNISRAKLEFFHVNNSGRILNRFSEDVGLIDDVLPVTYYDTLSILAQALGAIVIACVVCPYIIPFMLPLAFFSYKYQQKYVKSSREIRRLEAVTRSPVYSAFSAMLRGLSTIRAYGAQSLFRKQFLKLLDLNGSWWIASAGMSKWMGSRVDILCSVYTILLLVLVMVTIDKVNETLVAVALSQSLQLTAVVQWCVHQVAELENLMTSVERLIEYTNIPKEDPRTCDGASRPHHDWPTHGAITFQNISATYRAGLPLALRNVNISIEGGTSCGLVGRTGSGKSTMLLTLLRFINITSGKMFIDRIDVCSIGIEVLRQAVSVIPQDPVLFSGDIRHNLDPWGTRTDSALWSVLEQVKLKDTVVGMGGLNGVLTERGNNLSVGQRQLFCLARSLLSTSKILALDEATANVDLETDTQIQSALRNVSSRRTLIVIAHRLHSSTILDCDQVVVMDQGKVKQSGGPKTLLKDKNGLFRQLVDAAKNAQVPRESVDGSRNE